MVEQRSALFVLSMATFGKNQLIILKDMVVLIAQEMQRNGIRKHVSKKRINTNTLLILA